MNTADRKLRDQFALAAIAAMRLDFRQVGEFDPALIASFAYEVADAAIEERKFDAEDEP